MKKFKIFILIALVLGALSVFVGCDRIGALAAPEQLDYNIENELSWSPVEGARGYYVEIIDIATNQDKGEQVRRTTTKISLSFLPEGDYEIRVMALSKDDERNNKWSEKIHFRKEYETGCIYTLINNGTEYRLSKYGSAPETIYIEDEYRNKPVTEIAPRAFKGYSVIQNVEIGDNVRTIGDNAFYGCQYLKRVKFGKSVTKIGASAFQSCSGLETVILSESLTTIGNSAFAYCKALEELDLPEGLQSIGTYAFSDCIALEEVALPDTLTSLGGAAFTVSTSLKKVTIGSALEEIATSAFYKCSALETLLFAEDGKLKTIGNSAFADCFALKAVTIPDGVETIGASAFNMQLLEEFHKAENPEEEDVVTYTLQSNLESITIPNSITSIGTNAFYGTKHYMDGLDAANSYIYVGGWIIGASLDMQENLTQIDYDSFAEDAYGIADGALKNFQVLEKVYLPNSIRYIGGAGFQSNKKLRIFEMTNNSQLETVGMYALAGCRILDTVVLGPNVTALLEGAFASCERLNNTEDNVLTPDKLTKVGKDAFAGTKLTETSDKDGAIYAGNWLIGYDKNKTVTNVDLNPETVGIADYAFASAEDLKSIVIPNRNNLKYIGKGAFIRCKQLDMVDLSYTNIRRIEDYAFYACTSLSTISLPTRLTSIGRSAFYNCLQLHKVDLSKRMVEELGPRAFSGCINLETINFGDKLKTIGEGAFYQCILLEKVSLPNTVTYIGDYAFIGCQLMEELSLGSNVQEIGNYAFAYCNAIKRLSFSGTLKTIGDYAFYGCEGVRLISFSEGLQSIGDYAFVGTKAVASLNLPSTLEHVGNYAFAYNDALKSIIIKDDMATLGNHVFYGNSNLTVYVEGDTIPEGWGMDWNSSFLPVLTGCTLSENGEYVASIVISEGSLQNVIAPEKLSAPECLGATFLGWATSAGGEVVYTMETLLEAPKGITLYTVWSED